MSVSPQVARLQRRLEAIPKAVREDVEPTLDRNADELVTLMRQLAPDDPSTPAPDLKTSIKWREEGELRRAVFTDDFKARWLEFGTSKMDAQPYFWPAVRLLQKRLRNRTKRAISKAVRDFARRK